MLRTPTAGRFLGVPKCPSNQLKTVAQARVETVGGSGTCIGDIVKPLGKPRKIGRRSPLDFAVELRWELDYVQIRDSLELCNVCRQYRPIVVFCRCCDYQIVSTRHLTLAGQHDKQLSVNTRHFNRKIENGKVCEDRLDKRNRRRPRWKSNPD